MSLITGIRDAILRGLYWKNAMNRGVSMIYLEESTQCWYASSQASQYVPISDHRSMDGGGGADDVSDVG